MKAERNFDIQSRRAFCQSTVVGVLAIVTGISCDKRVKVFKYPENAEEIADFNEFFVAPDMTESELVRRLNITGTPKVSDAINGYGYKTWSQQNDLIKKVEFGYYNDGLNGLELQYANPVAVSMGRLAGLLGAPAPQGVYVGRNKTVPDALSVIAANVPSGQTPGPAPEQSSFRYRPKVSHPNNDGFGSEVTVDTDGRDSNVKYMDSLRLYRFKKQ